MIKRILTIGILALALSACSDSSGAVKALDGAGYTEIDTLGYLEAILRIYNEAGCSEDDFYVTKFVAKGPTGKKVRGVVCSGFWAKGSTIRLQ